MVAPTGRDAPLICDVLHRHGIECEPCASVQALHSRLPAGAGAIVLTEEALVEGALDRLMETVTAQPPWSDIALILMTSNGNRVQPAVRAALREKGARSVFLVERPVRLLALVSTVESALQSRKRQYELRDYLDERARNEQHLRQTQKLESVGLLAGGIAHDFNNLLTGILGNASLALEAAPPDSPARSMLQDVIDAGERAAHLTRQLLAYAGKGRFLIEVLDLSRHVREISSLVQSSIPHSVQLSLDLAGGLPGIEADPAQIQQVVMNLVINGAEAIPEGKSGTVLIMTRMQEVDENYIRTILPDADIVPGPYVALEVHDTGVGMDEATKARIFDPFFTTKFVGRGLGLAAVLGIVRGHKGALKIYSAPGRGSTFRVLFPAAGERVKAEEQVEGEAPLTGSGTVLVVDDEELVRRAAKATLERFGYTVMVAEDGGRGIEAFRARADQIALVLLDMTMPVMSGEETLRGLRSVQPGVKVILSSGYNEAEAIRRFAGKGLAGFVQKPYTATRLAHAIRSVLSRS